MSKTIKSLLRIGLPVLLIATGIIFGLRYGVYYPGTIVSGENTCWLGHYRLTGDGFSRLQKIIDRSEGMPENRNVAYFQATVDQGGNVTAFTLSLDTFDESGEYLGLAGYTYDHRKLSYSPPAPDNLDLVPTENPNSSIPYLDTLVRKIPLRKQIKLSGLERYEIQYQPYTVIEKGTPIFDGRNSTAFEPLSQADYNAGRAGVSDGKTNVVFRLYDGQSIAAGQQYLYVFAPIAPEAAVGNQLSTMQCDYYINNGTLQFTRNYGQDWLKADITKGELDATMEFYRNNLSLPPESLFISADTALPIAYFYGENPILKLSADSGVSWDTIPFPATEAFGRPITKRAVGFVTAQFGYAALGTDWSMGGGEHKMCYFTSDGGQSWTDQALPLTPSSSTLMDMAMADEHNGMVALDAGMDKYFPLLYVTADTGSTWQEIKLPYDSLPQEIDYLSSLDSLTYVQGKFTLTLGQGDSGTAKATFTAANIGGAWEFEETGSETIHTVG